MKLKAYKIDSTNKKVSHAAANKSFLPLANMTAGTDYKPTPRSNTKKSPVSGCKSWLSPLSALMIHYGPIRFPGHERGACF
jgi:hypothetical protein